jgi:myo-inositol 2-dehydrogenase / D-chiro-inositol 1-dehydrogenase
MTTRVGFIGAGSRSVSHMASFTYLDDVVTVGVTDLDTARADAAIERANSRRQEGSDPIAPQVFSDYRAMMDQVEVDCLYLCLPPFVHGDLDHALIDLNKPIMFEKPVAVDMGQANEIAAHVKEQGIVNGVGYQKRYGAAVQGAKQLLQGVPIGMAVSIRLSNLPGQPWWRVQAQSGGMLVEQHTHAVDLMRMLCGEVESAYAVGGTMFLQDTPNLDIFDMNACTLRFANGAPGIVGNSCASPEGAAVFPPHLVHVVAKDMVLSVNDKKTIVRHADGRTQEFEREVDDEILMNKTFIDAVRAGNQGEILSDFADGTRTLAVTLACQRSAERGEPIKLAEFMQEPSRFPQPA